MRTKKGAEPKTRTTFQPYCPEQPHLFPPDPKDWLPEGHLAYFILDVVKELDLTPIYESYDGREGGYPPYNPTMMTSLLLYAYCVGICSSRRIEKATYELIPFRVIAAQQHPDHDTIAEFRKRHLKALAPLFTQVLQLCQKAGLVKLGHVALDGTKVKANASKHKAQSYDRMEKTVTELQEEVDRMLREAQAADDQEDAEFGKGKQADELPEELRRKQARLEKIKGAKAALEAEAKAKADAQRREIAEKERALQEAGEKRKGPKPSEPSDKPDPKAQRNFTDPDSKIMKDGATKAFEQCYNCEAAVDEDSQIIVGRNLTQDANDKKQVKPLIEDIKENLDGATPDKVSADSGFFSEDNVKYLEDEEIDAYIATEREKHGQKPAGPPRGRIPASATLKERMTRKLRTIKGRATYKRRKAIVEPVFGQIKEARGIRRFLLRGVEKVRAEWDMICLTHNLLKLFRSGWAPTGA